MATTRFASPLLRISERASSIVRLLCVYINVLYSYIIVRYACLTRSLFLTSVVRPRELYKNLTTRPICTYTTYTAHRHWQRHGMVLYIDTVWSGPLAKCLTIDPFPTQSVFIIHIYMHITYVRVCVCMIFLRVFSTNSVLKIKSVFRRNGIQTQTIFQKSELEP